MITPDKATMDLINCLPCNEYLQRRSPLILGAGVNFVAIQRRMTQYDVKLRFVLGLHARHLSGKSIEVRTEHPMGRPRTPDQIIAGRFAALAGLINEYRSLDYIEWRADPSTDFPRATVDEWKVAKP